MTTSRSALGGLLLIFASVAPMRAQTPASDARLTIRVVDTAGRILPYAEVTFGERGQASTDARGRVSALKLKPGHYRIAARAIGYRARSLTVALAAGQILDTVIALSAAPMRLPDLETRAQTGLGDLYARLRLRGGRIITRTDIDRHWAIESIDLMGSMLGVRLEHESPGEGGISGEGGAKITFVGCRFRPDSLVTIWLDGKEMVGSPYQQARVPFAMELVHARELELMEIYRRSDEIPTRFRSGDACAALIMWTQAYVDRARRP